jgi:D-alanyl-D-alanine carboxypeptidase
MLITHLGATLGRAGTTVAGAIVARGVVAARNAPRAGVRFVAGWGLSLPPRAPAGALGSLLVSAWRDPAVRQPLFASLPIAGVDGTLKDRMRSGPARRRVRAKTGTTNLASALSGYAGTRYVFAVLQNGSPISWSRARQSQDRFAQALARAL